MEASGGNQSTSDWLLITPLALVLKTAPTEAAVFVADATTGEAIPNAEVVVFVTSYDNQTRYTQFQARTDETGLARVPLKHQGQISAITAWAARAPTPPLPGAGPTATARKSNASGLLTCCRIGRSTSRARP